MTLREDWDRWLVIYDDGSPNLEFVMLLVVEEYHDKKLGDDYLHDNIEEAFDLMI